jgi:hypothetical protein
MVAPLETHASGYLTTLSQAPKVLTCVACRGVRELACPGSHDLHGAAVPRDFLSPDPPHWGLAKRAALLRVWCAQELGPNSCRNLDRDTQREVKTHFILIQVGCSY